MAPAAAANEQAARERVKLQGSSSAAPVGAGGGARRATAQSAATRGWCWWDRAGWGATDRVGACGKRADRA
eukprot:3819620-Prymnesium_polylepis.1